MARLQQSLRQRSSASDSNLRCHEGEWPACSSRRGCDLPRPILFFVAAKENGSACSSRSSDEVRVCSILRCREEERFRLQSATNPRLHRFLISGSNLRIDAGFSPETPSSVHRFLISGPDLRIDARFSPETAQRLHRFLISGLDLGIDARFSPETPSSMHRFLISGGEFGNHCSTIVAAVRNCPPAAPVAATNFRDRF